jgi:hypothetical protein
MYQDGWLLQGGREIFLASSLFARKKRLRKLEELAGSAMRDLDPSTWVTQ